MNIKGTRIPISTLGLDKVPFHTALSAVVAGLEGYDNTNRLPSGVTLPFGIEKLEDALEDLGLDEVYERVLDRRFKAREAERAKLKAKMNEETVSFQDAKNQTFKIEVGGKKPKWASGDRPFVGRDSAFRKLAVVETLSVALQEGAGSWGPSDGIGVEFIVRCLGPHWYSVNSSRPEYRTA